MQPVRRTPTHRLLPFLLNLASLTGLLGLLAALSAHPAREGEPPWDPVATFSILGHDPETGEVGGAVQSRVFNTSGRRSAAALRSPAAAASRRSVTSDMRAILTQRKPNGLLLLPQRTRKVQRR